MAQRIEELERRQKEHKHQLRTVCEMVKQLVAELPIRAGRAEPQPDPLTVAERALASYTWLKP